MAVGRYCRTISFPNLTSKPSSKLCYHLRSISLPSHPSIPLLQHQISNLIEWHQSKPIIVNIQTTSSWLENALTQLKTLLNSLDHVLRDSLTRIGGPHLVHDLLDHFLRSLDVIGVFHTLLLSFKQEISSAQVAIRRKDQTKLIAYVKFHKKMIKEISKLLSAVDRPMTTTTTTTINDADESHEISTIIRDVLDLKTSVFTSVLESMLNSLGSTKRRNYSWVGLGLAKKLKRDDQNDVVQGIECQFEQLLRKKKLGEDESCKVLKKMQDMEDYVERMEAATGRVLRSLISTRVSLLNILTNL